ncbi:MAG: ABC transporter permease [Pseudomonadota bacterium]|nr:ABC transporter permease [Pseudomonadota bacterium]
MVRSPYKSSFVRPVRISGVNWIGVKTLYFKEVHRFLNVPTQTLLGPVVTAVLFMMIFSVVVGERVGLGPGTNFIQFLAPGLVMMTVLQNSFANTSSSITSAKVQGNIVDLLMPPLGPGEILTAMVAAAVTRGVLVAFVCIATFWFFDAIIPPPSLLTALLFLLLGAAVMAMAGLIAGVWAQKFEHLSAITNFIVQPLAFLSGTFYSIGRLPAPFDTIAGLNPFFMIIDGFRYGMTGLLESYLGTSFMVVAGMTVFLAIICFRLLASGFRLKS